MEKILLAVGSEELETVIKKSVNDDYEVVGVVLRKGQVIPTIEVERPDILILRENLEGEEDVKSLVMQIRKSAPYVRIIFLAGNRNVGDIFLSVLVSYNVYDILYGGAVKLSEILALIYSKNDYKDVCHLQPEAVFDKAGVSFNMPEVVQVQKKEVVVSDEKVVDEEGIRKSLYEEIEVKLKAQLREQYERDYQIHLKRGEDKEKDIEAKLEKKYAAILEENQNKWKEKMENIEAKAKNSLAVANKDMEQKIKEKEDELEKILEAKLSVLMKKNKELQEKLGPEEYEKKVRKKLEIEYQAKIDEYKKDLEVTMKNDLKEAKEQEMAGVQSDIIKKLEEDNKRILAEKNEELEREKIRIKKEADERIAKEINLKNKEFEEAKTRIEEESDRKIDKKVKEAKHKIEEESELKVKKAVAKHKEILDLEYKERLEKEHSEFLSRSDSGGGQNIISFIGGKSGVGTTTVAINVATDLALQGKKVLYIELNSYSPAVGYWYQLDNKAKGLELAVKAIKDGEYRGIARNVISSRLLKSGEHKKYYKGFPDSLDFLLFSQQVTLAKSTRIDISKNELRDLYFYMLQDGAYDYIIVDLRIDDEDEWMIGTLVYSSKIYGVVTQDISSLAYLQYRVDRVSKKTGIDVSKKINVIANMYEPKKVDVDDGDIKTWLGVNKVITIENAFIDILNANYGGYPAILGKNRVFSKCIAEISDQIKNK